MRISDTLTSGVNFTLSPMVQDYSEGDDTGIQGEFINSKNIRRKLFWNHY